jgi:hypothetical protein
MGLLFESVVAELTMVYGRYNELVHGVYKPTNITGEHHPVCSRSISQYLDRN